MMVETLWETWKVVREKLSEQYCTCHFNEATGLPVEELEHEVRKYLSEHPDEPRIRQKAMIFSFLLEHARIRVDPFDWFADHIDTGNILTKIRDEWQQQASTDIPSSPWVKRLVGYPRLDLSHTSPGWKMILEFGICGIRDRARAAMETAADDESRDFFTSVATVYEAIRKYTLRLAGEAERQGASRVIETLKNIAVRAPQTLQEALQLSYLYNHAQEIEGEYVRTQGTFDRLYLDYYRRDIQTKILTRDQAKELLKFYFDKFAAQHFGAGHNFCLGGLNSDGTDASNELTELLLEVFEERKDLDPKLSLRLNRNTPDPILRQATRCVATGINAIVFANDDIAYDMLLKRGKQPEELLDFVPVGCYEPAIMGQEMCCSMSALINLAQIVEFIFADDRIPGSIDEVMARCRHLLAQAISDTLEITRWWERQWP
jgi:formate C-acetyltransferase